jgi:hypothetical protein
MAPFALLLQVLSKPYDEVEGYEAFAQPAPANTMPYKTFCGT